MKKFATKNDFENYKKYKEYETQQEFIRIKNFIENERQHHQYCTIVKISSDVIKLLELNGYVVYYIKDENYTIVERE